MSKVIRRTACHVPLAAVLALALTSGARASSPGAADVAAATHAATLFPSACPAGAPLPSGTIVTIAGTGVAGDSGDGGPATAAMIDPSFGTIAFDASGALYFADGDASSIRRIGIDGTISTFAGPATGAAFVAPAGVAIDAAGDMYVADLGAGRIWKVDPSGTITSIAGTGVVGSSGDEGPATEAEIGASGIAIGPHGDLYFDDLNRYRTIDPAGDIHAFAGTGTPGFSGDGGPATKATFSTEIVGEAADRVGNVYLGDHINFRIRKVDPTGIITTVAGSGAEGYSGDGGPALEADLGTPHGVAVDTEGAFYFTDDFDSSTIRKVDSAGIISTIAGLQTAGFSGDCGPATAAQLSHPNMVAVNAGVVYIVDNGNGRIRMVVP